jgi:hypothetical protein
MPPASACHWAFEVRGAALGLVLLLAAACDPMTEKPGTAGNPAPPTAPLPAGVPTGAVSVGDDVFMVPAGTLDGCPSYRAFSPSKAVTQAMHFRKTGGGFTTNRAEADCTSR